MNANDEWEFEDERQRAGVRRVRPRGGARFRRRRRIPWIFQQGFPALDPVTDSAAAAPPPDPPVAPTTPFEEPTEGDGDGAEWEFVERTVAPVRLSWTGPLPLNAAATHSGGGVYIVEKGGKPVYVGETHSFADRMRRSPKEHDGTAVRLGRFKGSDEKSVRQAIEHAVVRTLTHHGVRLDNVKLVRPFKVKGRVIIQNVVPYPVWGPMFRGTTLTLREEPRDPNDPKKPGGVWFELSST